jgi:hypothetical protein
VYTTKTEGEDIGMTVTAARFGFKINGLLRIQIKETDMSFSVSGSMLSVLPDSWLGCIEPVPVEVGGRDSCPGKVGCRVEEAEKVTEDI